MGRYVSPLGLVDPVFRDLPSLVWSSTLRIIVFRSDEIIGGSPRDAMRRYNSALIDVLEDE